MVQGAATCPFAPPAGEKVAGRPDEERIRPQQL